MPGSQGAEGAQEVADGALTRGQEGGQSQDDEAQEGRPGKSARQGSEEGARRLGHLLANVLEPAARGAGLARAAAPLLAVDGQDLE